MIAIYSNSCTGQTDTDLRWPCRARPWGISSTPGSSMHRWRTLHGNQGLCASPTQAILVSSLRCWPPRPCLPVKQVAHSCCDFHWLSTHQQEMIGDATLPMWACARCVVHIFHSAGSCCLLWQLLGVRMVNPWKLIAWCTNVYLSIAANNTIVVLWGGQRGHWHAQRGAGAHFHIEISVLSHISASIDHNVHERWGDWTHHTSPLFSECVDFLLCPNKSNWNLSCATYVTQHWQTGTVVKTGLLVDAMAHHVLHTWIVNLHTQYLRWFEFTCM